MSTGPVAFPTAAFTRFWWAESVSTFGSYVSLIALQTLVVLTLDGDAQDVGWLNSARWLPYLVLGLVVGALVDRRRRRPLMIGTDLAGAVLLTSIPLAWALDVLTLPLLLVIVACYGAVSLVNDAASQSFIPRLVPVGDLQSAHARIDGANSVSQTAGPVVGGLLVKWIGAPPVILFDAAGRLFSALTLLRVRVEEPPPVQARTTNLLGEIRDGVRWIYRTSGLALLAVTTHLWFAANAVLGAVIAPYALVTLGMSAFGFGLVTAMLGVGGLLGALLSPVGGRRLGLGGAIITAHAVTALGVLAAVCAGLWADGLSVFVLLGLGQACHGFGIGFSNSHEMAYRQTITPDPLQARTNITMRSFNRAVIVVAAPLGGLLADRTGNREALTVAAVVFALTAVILLVSPFRRVRYSDSGITT